MTLRKPVRWIALGTLILTYFGLAYLADSGVLPQTWFRWGSPILMGLCAWVSPFQARTTEGGFPFGMDAKS